MITVTSLLLSHQKAEDYSLLVGNGAPSGLSGTALTNS